jgi:hypothetical protein
MASPFHVAVWALIGVAAVAKGIHSYVRFRRDSERANRIARGEHPPRFASYGDYVQSEWWHRIRDATLEHLAHKCDFCGSRAVQAHHTNYPERDLWGTESVKYLCAVCLECHDAAHGSRSRYRKEQCVFCGSAATTRLAIQPDMSRKRKYQQQEVCSRCEALALGGRAKALGWTREQHQQWVNEWHGRLRPIKTRSVDSRV